jgi:hypothetical protein
MSEEIIVRVGKTIYFDSFPSICLKKQYTLILFILQEKLFRPSVLCSRLSGFNVTHQRNYFDSTCLIVFLDSSANGSRCARSWIHEFDNMPFSLISFC